MFIFGRFGILAVIAVGAAWFYWSGARDRRQALVLIAATFLWGAGVARTVYALVIRSDAIRLQVSDPLTQFCLGLFELALLAIVLFRRTVNG